MEQICKNCKHCCNIDNTEKTKQAICNYPDSFIPVNIDDKCHFIFNKAQTCIDCDRFGNDYACFTVNADDSIYINGEKCIGFIDIDEVIIKNILFKWATNNIDYKTNINNIITEFESEFEYPFVSID